MHDTAMNAGRIFADTYAKSGMIVLDVGGLNVNGSLRGIFENIGCKYVSLDMVSHPSVDVVCDPNDQFPFKDNYFDIVVTTSCFEHDPIFWMTFRDMSRVTKIGGYIYMNAPSAGIYHGYPGDCWRFYKDAGKALESWSNYSINNITYPTKLISQHFESGSWRDNVCVWQRI